MIVFELGAQAYILAPACGDGYKKQSEGRKKPYYFSKDDKILFLYFIHFLFLMILQFNYWVTALELESF